MIRIPNGLANFRDVRADNCFYVDRTQYIEQLEIYAARFSMYLRPRRFGKSLFISILEHYYDVNKAGDFSMLFGDLYIGKHPTSLANQFMILRFDFSGIETNEVKTVHESFLMKVKEGFRNFMSAYPEMFTEAQQESIVNQHLASSVVVDFFAFYNKNKIQRKIYVLIDEYDQFTNELLFFRFHDFKAIVSKNGYVRKFYEVLKTEAGRGNMTTVQALSGNDWTFQMPNYVIKKLYYDYFAALSLGMDYNNLTHLIRESLRKWVWQGQIDDFIKYVEQALTKSHSNRDKIAYGEKHLKTLMIGLLYPYESYHIRSELEINGKYVDIFLERIPQVAIKHEILLELKYIKKEDALKWVDKDEKIVDPPASTHPPVVTPAKKGRKPKQVVSPVPTPVIPANPPVKSLLEHVSEKGAAQLADYMTADYFNRPNLLAYCLVFVGSECKKVLPYA
ncbi:MAG: hypothetical protein RIS64_2365 [Bacteroidota bacterium]